MMAIGAFTALCVAGGWLIKIVKGLKKPGDDVVQKLDRDNRRLNKHDEELDYLEKSMSLLMRSNLAMLGHMQTGNSTGKMAEVAKEIQDFLINN